MSRRYRLAYRTRANYDTAPTHHGPWNESKALIEGWVQAMNKEWPDLYHWLEVEPLPDPLEPGT